MSIGYSYNDGGRSKYFTGQAGDCCTRAIAIALNRDYLEIYNLINSMAQLERRGKKTSAREGVHKSTWIKLRAWLAERGWHYVACMGIGTGCRTHLKASELPSGIVICQVSKHLVTVIDGILQDTFDCSRNSTRCVYGYFIKQ